MNTPVVCPKCGLRHFGGRECFYDRLRAALGPVVPDERQDETLRWLAKWEDATVTSLVELFERCRKEGRS